MPLPLFAWYLQLPAFLLVLFRIGGLVLATPLFSGSIIPVQLRVLLTLAISAAVFPLISVSLAGPVTLAAALTGLFGELVIGLFIGFCVSVIFMAMQIAGEFIAHQSGLSLGTVYNPMLDDSQSILSQVYYFVAMIAFLAVGGHRALLRALLDSFGTIPPMSFKLTQGMTNLLLDLLSVSFELAIRIAGPSVLALMVALLVLGFLGRTIPQLNILNVGFPMKAALALLMIALTMMSMEPLLLDAFDMTIKGIRAGLGLPAT